MNLFPNKVWPLIVCTSNGRIYAVCDTGDAEKWSAIAVKPRGAWWLAKAKARATVISRMETAVIDCRPSTAGA